MRNRTSPLGMVRVSDSELLQKVDTESATQTPFAHESWLLALFLTIRGAHFEVAPGALAPHRSRNGDRSVDLASP
jgi:hypothetical protein